MLGSMKKRTECQINPYYYVLCYYTVPYYIDTGTGVEEAISTTLWYVVRVALELAARAALELGALTPN